MEELGGRSFICRNCAKLVVPESFHDRRSVFCCKECERKYWKKSEAMRKMRAAEAYDIYQKVDRSIKALIGHVPEVC